MQSTMLICTLQMAGNAKLVTTNKTQGNALVYRMNPFKIHAVQQVEERQKPRNVRLARASVIFFHQPNLNHNNNNNKFLMSDLPVKTLFFCLYTFKVNTHSY